MRKFEFIKPRISAEINDSGDFGRFVIEPLDRGYGITLGNSLRRVMLSSMPGVAIYAMELEGVEHEFMALPGILEDVTEIILNLKNVVLAISEDVLFKAMPNANEEVYRLELNEVGPKVITAKDFVCSSELKIINPDLVIANLEEHAVLKGEFFARRSVGYISAEANKALNKDKSGNKIIGRIAIDSICTPVTKVQYDVEKVRFEDNVDCDKLIIRVWTNGALKAQDAMSLASKFLMDHYSVISVLNEAINEEEYIYEKAEKVSNKKLEKRIEELDLSVRSYNCLKRANIHTVGELTLKTEEEMMRVRNLGRKSLKEVVQKLREIGLDLKRTYDSEYEEDDYEEEDDYDLSKTILDLDKAEEDDEDSEVEEDQENNQDILDSDKQED